MQTTCFFSFAERVRTAQTKRLCRWPEVASIILTLSGFLSGCSFYDVKQAKGLPENVQQILSRNCYGCHAGGASEGGFGAIDQRQELVRQGYILPGDADGSLLLKKVMPSPPSGERMPLGGPYLSEGEINQLSSWIRGTVQIEATGQARHATLEPAEMLRVAAGDSAKWTLSAKEGYKISRQTEGTCPPGSWSKNSYETGKLSSNCSVRFLSEVTASASGEGIVIRSPQQIDSEICKQTSAGHGIHHPLRSRDLPNL